MAERINTYALSAAGKKDNHTAVLVFTFILLLLLLLGAYWYFNRKSPEDNSLATLAKQGEQPTFLPAEYTTFADSLFEAMDGAGTDEAEITTVFSKMKNKADVIKLIAAFGTRKGSGLSGAIMTSPQTLPEWLNADGASAIANAALAANNIDYTF